MNTFALSYQIPKNWLFLSAYLVGAQLLSACTTPSQYSQEAICDSQATYAQPLVQTSSSPHSSSKSQHIANAEQMAIEQQAIDHKALADCHYFSSTTPYQRSAGRANYHWVKNHHKVNSPDASPMLTAPLAPEFALSAISSDMSLSIGDQLMINILNGEDFNAQVEVDANGNIYLPFLPPIKAQGLSLAQLNQAIANTLVQEQLMLRGSIRISIMPLKWAPIEINVSGSVYEPGQHLINRKSEMELQDDNRLHSGDQALERTISAALRSSGGIRPDADISKISVTRGSSTQVFDMRGVFDGRVVPHITLAAGDIIHVPSSRRFNDDLVRPSQITAPGIRVFISNLTQPASSNSQSAVDTEATRFPYGTRLLSGAIAANCVGGAQTTNASRHILLVTKNPLSNEMDVVERSLDKLIGQAWLNEFNPVLLPGDGIACYDSGVTNIREIARSLTEVLVPASLLNWL